MAALGAAPALPEEAEEKIPRTEEEKVQREQRFAAALDARKEGKGVKPRQGCAAEQLNRECKEDTKTDEFTRFLDVVRDSAEAEIIARHGTNAGSFGRADFLQVERPLLFAARCKAPDIARARGAWSRDKGSEDLRRRRGALCVARV